MNKLITLILSSFLIVLLLAACENSQGYDPNASVTVIDKKDTTGKGTTGPSQTVTIAPPSPFIVEIPSCSFLVEDSNKTAFYPHFYDQFIPSFDNSFYLQLDTANGNIIFNINITGFNPKDPFSYPLNIEIMNGFYLHFKDSITSSNRNQLDYGMIQFPIAGKDSNSNYLMLGVGVGPDDGHNRPGNHNIDGRRYDNDDFNSVKSSSFEIIKIDSTSKPGFIIIGGNFQMSFYTPNQSGTNLTNFKCNFLISYKK